jgi:hypothetical protein
MWSRKGVVFWIWGQVSPENEFNKISKNPFLKPIVYNDERRIGGPLMEDHELIRQILSGEQLAIKELHSRYVDRIFNYNYIQTNSYHDSEEPVGSRLTDF